jgi:carbamoyl-phosphate synthase large subunit
VVMISELNILFLGGAKRVSLAEHLKRSALSRNFKVSVFSYELSAQVPISSVAKVITGLKWSDENLIPDLQKIIKSNNIQMVIPFLDTFIETAGRLKKLHPELYIPCCNENICQIMFDKILLAKWFEKNNIPAPQTFNSGSPVFPVIMKPRKGSASKGIRVIYDQAEFDKVRNPDDYLIQDYIAENTEFTVDCFVSASQEILSVVPRIRLETAGGEVVNSMTVKDESIIGLSKKILQSDHFTGPVTIQFIKDLTRDRLYAMEINPRLGGGVIASIEAGADILGLMIDEFSGRPLVPLNDWKDKTLMTRYFKEVIFYADNN